METYILGVVVEFIIVLVTIIISITQRFSVKSRNLRKIGLHYNIPLGNYNYEQPSIFFLSFHFFNSFVIFPLLSWLAVALDIFAIIKSKLKQAKLPEKIKEIDYKLSNFDLPKEKVKELSNDLAAFLGLPEYDENETDEDDNILVLDSDDWYVGLTLYKHKHLYEIHSHSPDYDFQSWSLNEYKFDGTDLLSRTIEDKSEHMGVVEPEYDIKDNVVLESEIRARYNERTSIGSLDEKIANLKKDVEWTAVKNNRVKYFIMSKHPELFPEFELRKFLRSELERINLGMQKLTKLLEESGGKLTKMFDKFNSVEPLNENVDVERIQKIIEEENLRSLGLSWHEFENADEIRDFIKKSGCISV